MPLPSVVRTCPFVPSDKFNSDIPTWFAAICVLVTAFAAIEAEDTEFAFKKAKSYAIPEGFREYIEMFN